MIEKYVESLCGEVQSEKCKMQSEKCKMQSAKCRVQSAECKVQSAECKVQSEKCRVQSAECRVQSIESIYLGGGTPSILNIKQITQIFEVLQDNFDLSETKEVTFEANPEHLTEKYLSDLKKYTPVNRLSIGIQSFFQDDLDFLMRRHLSENAHKAIENALKLGFSNLTVDFIYGMPTLTDEKLLQNLQIAIDYGIEHISAYGLTIEPKTILHQSFLRKRSSHCYEELENKIARQYLLIHTFLTQNAFEHYETSNFAKNKKYSLHNTNYWNRTNYIGFGASAHSLTDDMRSWNESDVERYCENVRKDYEVLSPCDKYNEYVMTAIRTMWGIDPAYLSDNFPDFIRHFNKQISCIPKEYIQLKNNKLQTTLSGSLFADKIAEILFLSNAE
ncbi:coproporphyrinogen III oxidase [Bacteroidia bacterium]|nr:coproporphyrinogen III oxidase [Bacteroidia bacterium]